MSARIAPLFCLVAALMAGISASGATPAATIVVTNENDAGAGSLRQAILDSNASAGVTDTIDFNIPGGGVRTIVLSSALPDILDPVTINGQTQPGYNNVTPMVELNGAGIAAPDAVLTVSAGGSAVFALSINRGPDAGIRIRTNGGNTIGECAIGTDPTGTVPLGNATHGVVVENVGNNQIGSVPLGRNNVISGNGIHGVLITGAAATSNLVANNQIGTDWAGTAAVGNGGFGVLVVDANDANVRENQIYHNASGGVRVQGSILGALVQVNDIASNGAAGVSVLPPAGRVDIRDNQFRSNAGIGIDLDGDGRSPNDPGDADAGANDRQNFPVLTTYSMIGVSQTIVFGRLEAAPSTQYRIDLYKGPLVSSLDDPQVVRDGFSTSLNVTTDGTGAATFSLTVPLLAGFRSFTATATDGNGNTSELSPALVVLDLAAGECGTTGAEALLPLALALIARRRRRFLRE